MSKLDQLKRCEYYIKWVTTGYTVYFADLDFEIEERAASGNKTAIREMVSRSHPKKENSNTTANYYRGLRKKVLKDKPLSKIETILLSAALPA